MHTGNFATMHHALKSAGMDSEHSGCLVTVEERFDARSSKNGQAGRLPTATTARAFCPTTCSPATPT